MDIDVLISNMFSALLGCIDIELIDYFKNRRGDHELGACLNVHILLLSN